MLADKYREISIQPL